MVCLAKPGTHVDRVGHDEAPDLVDRLIASERALRLPMISVRTALDRAVTHPFGRPEPAQPSRRIRSLAVARSYLDQVPSLAL